MKNICVFIGFLLLISPVSSEAAWYFLVNPSNPKQGDFVELSALEYAETEVSKDNLIYIEDDLIKLLNTAEHSDSCKDKYDSILINLQNGSSSTIITTLSQNILASCLNNEEKQNKLEQAIKDCDLEYLNDELSSSEKVTYNKEISVCKENEEAEMLVEDAPLPSVIIPTPPVIKTITPTTVNNTSEVVFTPPQPKSEESLTEQERVDEQNTVEEQSDETNQKNEQKIVVEEEVTPVSTPNFVQKIISFFVRLFTW